MSRPHTTDVRTSLDDLLRLILTSRVYDVAHETPLEPAARLSSRLRNQVLLKREDLQPIFSYKLRGAYNRIAHLSDAERAHGVIAASAGNHAQGVAFAARHLGLTALIVMPQTTPEIKVDAVRAMGAEVVLAGDTYADAKARCDELVATTGRTFVHPFDDWLVIAGQGTIGDEILRHRLGDVSAIFVPVGGGGLIAGIAGYVKAVKPSVRVIGVEPFEADAMYQSLHAGRRVALDRVGIFADGVAVREVGELTFPIVQATVEEIVRVTNDEICAAIKDVFDDTRTIMEPAGALAVAGLRAWLQRTGTTGARFAAVLSGANMNFDRLRFVAERAELGEAHEALFGVTIPERPGAFREFCATIGRRVVTEFNYRLSGRNEAHIFVGIATRSRQDAADVVAALTGNGIRRSSSPTTRSPNCTCATWLAAARSKSPTSRSAGSSFRSARGRCCNSSTSLGDGGTSACSITGITAPTSAACWQASRCRRPNRRRSRSSFTAWATSTSGNATTPRTGCFSAREQCAFACVGT
jgi:threonine dehydratase